MTRQNFLHLLKLEELTFQMSQERKLCDEGFGHSASGSLRDTHTHTHIHTSVHYYDITALTTMWRARKNWIKVYHGSGNVKLDVLNEVLWQLLLKLLDHKSECAVGDVNAAAVVGDSQQL